MEMCFHKHMPCKSKQFVVQYTAGDPAIPRKTRGQDGTLNECKALDSVEIVLFKFHSLSIPLSWPIYPSLYNCVPIILG